MNSGRPYADLRAGELLTACERGVVARRREEVDDLLRLLAWADLHSVDPRSGPGAVVPARQGGPRLERLGGEGTPEVVDLALAEIAIARSSGVVATRNATADALDLRHRLPNLYAALLDLRVEPWAARRVASTSRTLTLDQAALVDLRVTAAVACSPPRLLDIAAAAILEAQVALPVEDDPVGDHGDHSDHGETGADQPAALTPLGVRVTHPTPGPAHPLAPALVEARLGRGDAFWLDRVLDDLATRLRAADRAGDRPERSHDAYRAAALGLLARPSDAARLLTGEPADEPVDTSASGQDTRRSGRVFVHLHAETLAGLVPGVARVEDLGPLLLEQLTELLSHTDVTLTPVVDLAEQHGTGHGGYRVVHLGPGRYLWRTPHGLLRLVDHAGTHALEGYELEYLLDDVTIDADGYPMAA